MELYQQNEPKVPNDKRVNKKTTINHDKHNSDTKVDSLIKFSTLFRLTPFYKFWYTPAPF